MASSHVRRHDEESDGLETPSRPPMKKYHYDGPDEAEGPTCFEPSVPCGPTQRRFHFVKIRSICFAIPDGYEVDPDKIVYLGGGAYGNVIKTSAICRDGVMRYVAIKKLKDPFTDPFQARRIYREIKLLQLMRHDNIICALDLYSPDDEDNFKNLYVVTEYAGRSIFKILKEQRDRGDKMLKAEHVKFVVYQVLRALKYIHSGNIIHRDLKPGNLALTSDSDLTVLDFGLARSLERRDSTLTQYVQTRWYRSPEVIYWRIDSYTKLADMWSVGCIAAELLTGEPLFPGDDVNMQYQRITQLCGSPDAELLNKIEQDNSTAMRTVIESFKMYRRQNFAEYFASYNPTRDFIDFLERILVLDPEKRLTVEEAIQHEYMSYFSMPDDEPSANGVFELNDSDQRSIPEWKRVVWNELINFKREAHSPALPGEPITTNNTP